MGAPSPHFPGPTSPKRGRELSPSTPFPAKAGRGKKLAHPLDGNFMLI
jgi:hypothetical protein